MKNFKVKSVKVPENVKITFFKEEFYKDDHVTAEESLDCLTTPFDLSFM